MERARLVRRIAVALRAEHEVEQLLLREVADRILTGAEVFHLDALRRGDLRETGGDALRIARL